MFRIKKLLWIFKLSVGAVLIGLIELILVSIHFAMSDYFLFVNLLEWYYLRIAIFSIHILAAIMLITSYFKRAKEHLYLYLTSVIFRFIIVLASILHAYLTKPKVSEKFMKLTVGRPPVGLLVFDIWILVLGLYFWICIYSWYRELKETDRSSVD